jgi:phage anti-repressor protein
MELTSEIVFALLQSDNPFPVDFDDGVEWWDCQTKNGTSVRRDSLVRKLKMNFHEDFDYHLHKNVEMVMRQQGGGARVDKYFLSIECFKMMGMMLSGAKGRQIRQYFLDCEAELKRRLAEDAQTLGHRIIKAFVSDKIESRRPRFTDEFYELLYAKRGDGWENRDPKNRPSCVGTWTNKVVYDRFPEGVKDRLNEVNPRVDGRRKNRHHWHLRTMGSVHLDGHIPAVMAVARVSPDGNWDKFMRNINKAFPNGEALQMSLLDYLEDAEDSESVS